MLDHTVIDGLGNHLLHTPVLQSRKLKPRVFLSFLPKISHSYMGPELGLIPSTWRDIEITELRRWQIVEILCMWREYFFFAEM